MIGIVIVDYNCESMTRRCLASLIALGRKDLRYYVVDNGRTLDRERLISQFTAVDVLVPDRNLGFAGGSNVGMARAVDDGATYCLLINPDTTAQDDFVQPMLEVMEKDQLIGMACPTLLADDGSDEIAFGGSKINWWSGRPCMIRKKRLEVGASGFTEVPFVTGATMLLRARAVQQVGPMDEKYFLYFEDTDYTQRFKHAGWKTIYVPRAETCHKGSGIVGFRSETYHYYFARNRIRFMRRWGRWYHRMVFGMLNSFVRLPAMLLVFGILPRKPKLAYAYLRGYIDGMLGRSGKASI